jgi:hypothetical protein
MSVGKAGDLDSACRDNKCPPDAHDSLDSANTLATISTIGFIGAGIGAALAATALVMGNSGAGKASATGNEHHAPKITIGKNGAMIMGVF